MAFHVACPITSRRICFCSLGFPQDLQSEKAKNEFFDEVARVEKFFKDPWLLRVRDEGTVQVAVPKVVPPPPPPPPVAGESGGGCGDPDELSLSAMTKRVALQRKAAVASMVAEDYARRFESGDLTDASRDLPGKDHGQSSVKVMCRLCYFGENEGSERAKKMLSCKSCGKKYHRSCLKAWAQNRALCIIDTGNGIHILELSVGNYLFGAVVCRRTGDQTRFMFCRRCDGAYHCYCQQPPHKNVSSGPYLCPKHTKCHSCGSTVPGNGLSVRWFLGYTCCDACGRLFVKGNYCPVCLKVYRDSESTPMVCCDVCQRWVHCQCDGISDEKYLQFQVDGNLQYKCATCRGECYQVRDLEDSVQELWRRRDEADRDLIASLRAAAGLPTQEEIFYISPYSDDEESAPVILKNEYGRSLKFSLKGLVDKSPKMTKEYGKKSSNKKSVKKVYHPSFRYSRGDDKNDDMQSQRSGECFTSPVAGSLSEGICSINQAGVLKHKFIDEVTVGNENVKSRVVQIKNSKPHDLGVRVGTAKDASKSKTTDTKGPKLVIHLGARNRNVNSPPRSDASSYQREQELTTSHGSEDVGQEQMGNRQALGRHGKFADGKGDKVDPSKQLKDPKLIGKEGNLIKIKKINSEVSDMNPKNGVGNMIVGNESVSPLNHCVLLGKRSTGESTVVVDTATELPAGRGEKVYLRKNAVGRSEVLTGGNNDSNRTPSDSHSLPRNSKPLLKLKFKNPCHENQSSWAPLGEDEKSSVKGQSTMNEIMDANWILQKLGKDAIGKRVEVHQPSDNSWHKGVVKDVIEGTSIVSVALDDGKHKKLELGKQGIRFVSQKQKR
ncbi:PHD finger family protein [Actinidia rufa]|uniref:PHD finger family protein n=1 Tax=Actinidia rufa TaxID=165716 RepID=A0A7J0FNY8_9ERIC|nr:PHD finger family protein [Actinidia rufa]